jgi:hypothetical protein
MYECVCVFYNYSKERKKATGRMAQGHGNGGQPVSSPRDQHQKLLVFSSQGVLLQVLKNDTHHLKDLPSHMLALIKHQFYASTC